MDPAAAQIRDGLTAAKAGKPATSNPWKPETLGGHAWAFGWSFGRLPDPFRWAARVLAQAMSSRPPA